eukprot:TRINITY_DN15211_c0_g2_i2.p1 TRINITY_DN15211_c0_g2~~TRINITY_DN15211_c0_g2_i2.p1  ORF type:complete len:442 (-),score=73.88 TRINITY_DN15211_c0_g2_i2:178-1503(-)
MLTRLDKAFDRWLDFKKEAQTETTSPDLPEKNESAQQQEIVDSTRSVEDAPAADPSVGDAVQEEQAGSSDVLVRVRSMGDMGTAMGAAVGGAVGHAVERAASNVGEAVGEAAEHAAEDAEADAEHVNEAVVEAVQEFKRRPPVFTLSQVLVCVCLWMGGAFATLPEGGSLETFVMTRGGLESIFPGRTMLQIHGNLCEDYRAEVWRWISYQWTHSNFLHISMNVFSLIVAGTPLELFHGTLRIFLVFELSVIGGAFFFFLMNVHSPLVGMSAGCYALIAMHAADLLLNWAQTFWRKRKLASLIVLLLADAAATWLAKPDDPTSSSAHFGGALAGFMVGVVLARNKVVHRWEQALKAFIFLLALALSILGVAWAMQWPPRTLYDTQGGYCAVLQIWKQPWAEAKCTFCGSQACVNKYSTEPFLSEAFTQRGCEKDDMSWYTE